MERVPKKYESSQLRVHIAISWKLGEVVQKIQTVPPFIKKRLTYEESVTCGNSSAESRTSRDLFQHVQ